MCMNITVIDKNSSNHLSNFHKENGFGFHINTLFDLPSPDNTEQTDVFIIDCSTARHPDFSLTRKLRSHSRSGIILIGKKNNPDDLIVALEMGADEYLAQPVNYRELSARIRNLGRWSRMSLEGPDNTNAQTDSQISHFGGWQLDLVRQVLKSPTGQLTKLPKNEFTLLTTLLNNRNQLMTREALLNALYHREWHPSDRTIDMLIGKLRKKLNDYQKETALINTVYGVGYIFAAQTDVAPNPTPVPVTP